MICPDCSSPIPPSAMADTKHTPGACSLSRDAVERDWLLERGYALLTPWHLRCVEAALGSLGLSKAFVDPACARLWSDLRASSIDVLHAEAEWENARHVAAKSQQVATLARLKEQREGNPCEARIYSRESALAGSESGSPPTLRVEVWRRRKNGHRLVVMRLRPVAARKGRLTWAEDTHASEELSGTDEQAVARAKSVLEWLGGRP